MNPTIQSGTHPDAESLTAFAEQLLTGAERDQILGHMAMCSRCREVVFLAQRAIDAERATDFQVDKSSKNPMQGWFRGWRLAWIPVAALAGFVGFAVVQHMRRATPEMAGLTAQTEAVNGRIAAKTATTQEMQQTAKRDQPATLPAVRPSNVTRKEETSEAAVADKKQLREKDRLDQPAGSRNEAVNVSGGAVNGVAVARAKSSSPGGPMAQNQMLQENYNAQQNTLATGQAGYVANKPQVPAASPAGADHGTVSDAVAAVPGQQAAVVSPAPAPVRELSVPVTGQNLAVTSDERKKVKDFKVLPSGLGLLSVAVDARRTIAIDTAGAVFLSEDDGRHWQPVKTQWSGRAVLVRRRPSANSALLSLQQMPLFELVSDNLRTWVSTDGKTWTEQTSPGK